jgi:hypothetical protein
VQGAGAALLAATTLAFVAGSAVAGVLAAALLAAFLLVERRRPDPMLPLGLFRRPGFSAANAVGRHDEPRYAGPSVSSG